MIAKAYETFTNKIGTIVFNESLYCDLFFTGFRSRLREHARLSHRRSPRLQRPGEVRDPLQVDRNRRRRTRQEDADQVSRRIKLACF
jgi:hypothetical protein